MSLQKSPPDFSQAYLKRYKGPPAALDMGACTFYSALTAPRHLIIIAASVRGEDRGPSSLCRGERPLH